MITTPNAGVNDEIDSDADQLFGKSPCITLAQGEINLTIDAGFKSTSPPCDNITDGGIIGFDESNCGSYDPALIENVALPSGGSGDIEYVWLASTAGCPNNINQAIPNSNSPEYDPPTINQTTWYLRCSRRVGCTTFVESNCVVKEVQPGCEDCNITISTCPNKILIEGLDGPNVIVQVFNSNWNEVFYCFNNCANPAVITGLPSGDYFVKVYMADAQWDYYCTVEEWITVTGTYLMAPEHSDVSHSEQVTSSKGKNTGIGTQDVTTNHIGSSDTHLGATQNLRLYPNPASRLVTLNWDGTESSQKVTVNLFNSLGQIVKTITLDGAAREYKLELEGLRDGQYIVQLIPEGKVPIMKKLAISH
jgi:hypothetical protein